MYKTLLLFKNSTTPIFISQHRNTSPEPEKNFTVQKVPAGGKVLCTDESGKTSEFENGFFLLPIGNYQLRLKDADKAEVTLNTITVFMDQPPLSDTFNLKTKETLQANMHPDVTSYIINNGSEDKRYTETTIELQAGNYTLYVEIVTPGATNPFVSLIQK